MPLTRVMGYQKNPLIILHAKLDQKKNLLFRIFHGVHFYNLGFWSKGVCAHTVKNFK